MRRFSFVALPILTVAFVLPVAGQNQQAQSTLAEPVAGFNEPPMTNADVIKMVKAGLSEALIITSIRQAKRPAFVLTPDALIELKGAGVGEYVLTVMVDPKAEIPYSAPAQAPVQATEIDNNPLAPHDAGIYVDVGKQTPKLVLLEPAVFSQGKSGGVFVSKLTYGIAKASWKAVVRGRTANQRVQVRQPTFYFHFEQKGAGLSNTGGYSGWFAGASSPNEFVLARMDQKSDGRELVVSQAGTFGSSAGTRSKDTVNLNIERLAPGVYRVKPVEPLEVGREYCFFYAGGAGGSAALAQFGIGVPSGVTPPGKLFDFGVDASDVPKSK